MTPAETAARAGTTPLGLPEIAAHLDVRPQTVRLWHSRGKLPPPDWTTGAKTGLWAVSTIDEWAASR